jgi:hypothetical protein
LAAGIVRGQNGAARISEPTFGRVSPEVVRIRFSLMVRSGKIGAPFVLKPLAASLAEHEVTLPKSTRHATFLPWRCFGRMVPAG